MGGTVSAPKDLVRIAELEELVAQLRAEYAGLLALLEKLQEERNDAP